MWHYLVSRYRGMTQTERRLYFLLIVLSLYSVLVSLLFLLSLGEAGYIAAASTYVVEVTKGIKVIPFPDCPDWLDNIANFAAWVVSGSRAIKPNGIHFTVFFFAVVVPFPLHQIWKRL